ncbi:hypothetical protein ELS78_05140 [Aeromonas veronii]|uniref:hypothetical protein n=1 Tax=Aeromonas veronii TaxID=654 RepID=UPI000F8F459C|nr:hypothetical protein [Aeromonas veronii]RUR58461.1 hypothetical protein ELS78_05140 [Aeromonas veronii]
MTRVEQVFITQFNFKKIIPLEAPPNIKLIPIHELIKYNELVKIFNKNELNQFIKLWSILVNPEFLKIYYESKMNNDQRPEAYSSYHYDKYCIELSKDYLDYTIKSENKQIRTSIGAEIRHAFREFTYGFSRINRVNLDIDTRVYRFDFKNNLQVNIDVNNIEHPVGKIPSPLYEDVCKIKMKYPDTLGDLFDIIPNSGIFSYENISLDMIEMSITNLIERSIKYREQDQFTRAKINAITYSEPARFRKIRKNDKKGIEWMSLFKEPLMQLINNYLWVKYNPEFSVDKSILENLSFRPCQRCIKSR